MNLAFFIRRLFPKDWRPVGPTISSPDGKMLASPMLNSCIANRLRGRFVTIEVRNERGEFMHAMQTDVSASESWRISWRANHTVVVSGSESGEWAYGVGIDSLVYPHRHPPYPGWSASDESN